MRRSSEHTSEFRVVDVARDAGPGSARARVRASLGDSLVRTVHAILLRMNLQYVELTNYITKQHGRY